MSKKPQNMTISRDQLRLASVKVSCGTYPGQNRARVFKDRKKEAKRKECRGRVRMD